MTRRLWLTWEIQRRNRTTSKALGARLYELVYRTRPLRRYPRAILVTLWLLLRQRPRLLFAQNPSLVLATLAVLYGRLSRTPAVIDAHNTAIPGTEPAPAWVTAWRQRLLRTATATIVSNPALAEQVMAAGGRPLVLPDPLPELPRPAALPALSGSFNVLFVCTWAADEPYLEVLEAASQLPEDTRIYITGNSKGRETAFGRPLPSNVELTGFVSEEAFLGLLHAADLVVDLTTREDCLVCGAYEAVAAERPLLLSDTAASRSYFSRGTLYTDNSAADIARCIAEARARQHELEAEIHRLKGELEASWQQQQKAVLEILQRLEGGGEVPLTATLELHEQSVKPAARQDEV